MKYDKKALTIDEQIDLLIKRDLVIEDVDEARLVLANISYYRFSSYLYPYRIPNDENQKFYPNTKFNDALKIYSFDRKLRLLLFDAIERVEIAFRTQFILQMSHKYGPYWYIDKNLFHDKKVFDNIIESFKNEYGISNELFIEHYKNKYSEPAFPPSWISIEIFTFGQLSRHFKNLKFPSDKKMIARYFKLNYPVFESWLHSISYIRNICAHHSRLWNRSLRVRPLLPTSDSYQIFRDSGFNNTKVYAVISILKYLLDVVHPANSFKQKLKNLIDKYPIVKISKMGFTDNWDRLKLWKNSSENDFHLNEETNAIDSLKTAMFLCNREDNLKWKSIILFLHHSLYSFCTSVITNGNYDNVFKSKKKPHLYYYSRDSINWKKSISQEVYNTDFYRFFWEDVTDEKELKMLQSGINNNDINDDTGEDRFESYEKAFVIEFPLALARVMDGEWWMARLSCTQPLELSDEEIYKINEIHILRNEFIHFKPQLGSYSIPRIKEALKVYIKSIDFLVFNAHSSMYVDEEQKNEIKNCINYFNAELQK
jgi:abortive infection bacteriophage resistance protein